MPDDKLDSIIPPVRFRFDGCEVTIYEVSKISIMNKYTWYHINLDIEWRGKKSQRFPLDAKNWDDFLKKLLVETTKFKWFQLCGVTP